MGHVDQKKTQCGTQCFDPTKMGHNIDKKKIGTHEKVSDWPFDRLKFQQVNELSIIFVIKITLETTEKWQNEVQTHFKPPNTASLLGLLCDLFFSVFGI